MRFDNRVAIVTGAGNGLGRAYAAYLGARGAKVLVNDTATTRCEKTNTTSYAADKVVAQLGGTEHALANYDSVVEGRKLVDAAMNKCDAVATRMMFVFAGGRVDIVVNNAGIVRDTSFARMSQAQWDAVYKVHLEGTMSVTKACWEIMREQNFGRIVNISSASGLYGNFGQANYSAAKMGIAGLTFTLSKEGAKRNVLSNVVAPLAASQMTDGIVEEELFKLLKPEHVAPFVAYLCHESCTRNGNVYEVGAGWVAKVRWERSRGLVFPPNGMELDDIAAQMDEIEHIHYRACHLVVIVAELQCGAQELPEQPPGLARPHPQPLQVGLKGHHAMDAVLNATDRFCQATMRQEFARDVERVLALRRRLLRVAAPEQVLERVHVLHVLLRLLLVRGVGLQQRVARHLERVLAAVQSREVELLRERRVGAAAQCGGLRGYRGRGAGHRRVREHALHTGREGLVFLRMQLALYAGNWGMKEECEEETWRTPIREAWIVEIS
ncbi:Peroxisomal multifunctional enzyme type 2, partial [Globisporangium splendens]